MRCKPGHQQARPTVVPPAPTCCPVLGPVTLPGRPKTAEASQQRPPSPAKRRLQSWAKEGGGVGNVPACCLTLSLRAQHGPCSTHPGKGAAEGREEARGAQELPLHPSNSLHRLPSSEAAFGHRRGSSGWVEGAASECAEVVTQSSSPGAPAVGQRGSCSPEGGHLRTDSLGHCGRAGGLPLAVGEAELPGGTGRGRAGWQAGRGARVGPALPFLPTSIPVSDWLAKRPAATCPPPATFLHYLQITKDVKQHQADVP